jgi:hypothetical protein
MRPVTAGGMYRVISSLKLRDLEGLGRGPLSARLAVPIYVGKPRFEQEVQSGDATGNM